jgi:hypothetical protein
MITRRDFIKGMGALALIPLMPGMLKPSIEDDVRLAHTIIDDMIRKHRWEMAGEMLIPRTGDGETTRIRYTVHPDRTDAEIVEE